MELLKDLSGSLFKDTFILVGIYVALGCIFQRKGFEKTVSAVFKSSIAIILMSIGGSVVGEALVSFTYLFQRSFKLLGIVVNNERLVAYSEIKFGYIIYSLMVFGLIVNLVMAKKTKFKYIFLTGHQILYMSCVLTIILSYFDLPDIVIVLFGGALLGVMMSVFPALIQPYTKQITGKENVAVGHFSSLGFYLCAKVGYLFNKKDAEQNEKKSGHPLIVDNMLATAISMVILFTIASLIAGKSYVEDVTNTNYLIFAIKQGLYFATGVYIILTGVRMMISEIISAFRGIADKLVPDAIPALDCSVLFPYKQNMIILGFVGCMLGGILSMFIMGRFSLYVVIPSSTICFFSGSAAGLYGSVKGGKKGAIVSAVLFGVAIGMLPLALQPEMNSLGFYKVAMGEFDFTIVALIIKKILSIFM
ncbi:PTS ascorbate transporter subunit IIC [Clostridium sediminicola]|uniref:PTS ascorbate transporter subunit IIC n=1 Tax=Clostridium sediminicola TaxID=3114879 RepID=UPI0031F1F4B1